ncbi:hypothetical protein [Cupriavidus necator]|uniref:hypothetical protein n=1 Tax=Cupriavidus necator TaxID=106590 RepID=UPI000B0F0B41|nr:hypothetical protein [Cupriavidus necator]
MHKTLATLLCTLFTSIALAQQYAPGPYERELDGKIYEAIAAQDWGKAQDLAVTPRQKQMVMEAVTAERGRRAEAARANRPTVCTGQAGSYGSFTQVCR